MKVIKMWRNVALTAFIITGIHGYVSWNSHLRDRIRVLIPENGWVEGVTVWMERVNVPNPDNTPQVGDRMVNMFLGIPYSKPPVYERRFKPPEPRGPKWDENLNIWNASKYQPACPQEIWNMQSDFYLYKNTSEDCLYLNIFAANRSWERLPERNRNYPVMVFINGEEYKFGTAQQLPGLFPATKDIVVVTFNYRIGALGFLSTEDENARGNWGMLDQIAVLKWVKKHIYKFGGNPDMVTIAGGGSGGGSVGLHLVSPMSRGLFHRANAMSGTDLCEWSVVTDRPLGYAQELGRTVGCDPDDPYRLVDCLRQRTDYELVNATLFVYPRYGSMAGPFGPVVDGEGGFLPKSPEIYRAEQNFAKVHFMAGVTQGDGCFYAKNLTKGETGFDLEEGLDVSQFRRLLYKMVGWRSWVIRNVEEVVGALEFQYTYWSNPDNKTAITQNLVDLWSDQVAGFCVDATLKSQAPHNTTYMYTFNYRPEFEVLPKWMGVAHGRELYFLFGFPFFNATFVNITGVVSPLPTPIDAYLDRNISDFMMQLWANFTRYGTPTVDWVRNVSWYPYVLHNLSYLHINEWSYMDVNYRQNYYGFWSDYFPKLASRWPVSTTPLPTPYPLYGYQAATWSLTGIALIVLFIVIGLGITLWRRSRSDHFFW